MPPNGLSPNYFRLSAAALLAAVAFGVSILVLGGGGVTWLHETAGLVLLLLLSGTVAVARGARPRRRGALLRALAALGLLVAMGAAGAALAIGIVPPGDDFVPLVILIPLTLLLAEMVRFALAAAGRAPSA